MSSHKKIRDLDALTAELIEAATRAGAEAADALALEASETSVGVRGGRLEEAERAESLDFGLRVLVGPRQACVSASDPRPEVIAELAERAVAMAKAAPDDPNCGLLPTEALAQTIPDLDLSDDAAQEDPAALEEAARRIEAASLAIDRVNQVEQASAGITRARRHLAASNGFSAGYAQTRFALTASAVAGDGLAMETDYEFATRRKQAALPEPGRDRTQCR